MGSVRRPPLAAAAAVVSSAAAVLIALGGAAGPASAEPGPGGGEAVTVTPAQIRPGGDLDIRTQSCGNARTGTVISTAFVTEVALAPAPDGGLFGSAVVSSSMKAGTYPMAISCNGNPKAAEGRFTVMGRELGQEEEGQQQSGADFGFQSPVSPVHAGGGGTARLAVKSGTASGAGFPGMVAAGALTVAGVAGLVLHRRRGGRRQAWRR